MNRGLNFYAIILVTIVTLVFSVNEFGVVHATTGIDLGNNPAQSNQVPDLKSDPNDNDDNNNDKSSNNNNNDNNNNKNTITITMTITITITDNNNNNNNNNDDNNNDKSSSSSTLPPPPPPPTARTMCLWLYRLIPIWPMNPIMRRIIQV